MKKKGENISEQLDILSLGPSRYCFSYKGYIVNGFRFHTKDHEIRRKTQNSGVFVSAETTSFSSARDVNPVTGVVGYYGVLEDIVELVYSNENRIILFKCGWWDVMSRLGMKKDEYGFTTVNFTRTLAANEPFILASQAQQIFYLQDNMDENWRVVLKTQPRDLYDMGSEFEPIQDNRSCTHLDVSNIPDDAEAINSWTRDEIRGIEVIANNETDQNVDVHDEYDHVYDSDCIEESDDGGEEEALI